MAHAGLWLKSPSGDPRWRRLFMPFGAAQQADAPHGEGLATLRAMAVLSQPIVPLGRAAAVAAPRTSCCLLARGSWLLPRMWELWSCRPSGTETISPELS